MNNTIGPDALGSLMFQKSLLNLRAPPRQDFAAGLGHSTVIIATGTTFTRQASI